MNTLFDLALVLCSVACSSLAQILLKQGMASASVQQALASGNSGAIALSVLLSATVPFGLFLYGLGALVWLFVLARVDVSVAYPFMSLGFVITMVLGFLVFSEPVTARKAIGAFALMSGVYLIAASP